jgi:hypothetical protein
MTEKLYLYDVVDATPRFVVHGNRVCRLNGEAVFVIDGDARTLTPVGADKPVFKLQGGWVVACGRAVLCVAGHGQDPGWRGPAGRRDQHGRVKVFPAVEKGEGRRGDREQHEKPGGHPGST